MAAERARADLYGHGTIEHAVDVARRARARQLVITHHAPMRSDDDVEALVSGIGATLAVEGMVMRL